MDGYVQGNTDNEVDVNETKASEQLEVYMAELRTSGKLGRGRGRKGKGRGRGRGRSASKGRGKGTIRKTKSDDHFRRPYQKPKKGPRRNLSKNSRIHSSRE